MRLANRATTAAMLIALAAGPLLALPGCGDSVDTSKPVVLDQAEAKKQGNAMEAYYKANPPSKAAKKR